MPSWQAHQLSNDLLQTPDICQAYIHFIGCHYLICEHLSTKQVTTTAMPDTGLHPTNIIVSFCCKVRDEGAHRLSIGEVKVPTQAPPELLTSESNLPPAGPRRIHLLQHYIH